MLNSRKHNEGDDDVDDDDDDRNDDDHNDEVWGEDDDQCLECYTLQSRVKHGACRPSWIKHVGVTQHRNINSTPSSWMATLLHSLRFRQLDQNVASPPHFYPASSHHLVYVLESDLQTPAATSGDLRPLAAGVSGSHFKPETTGSGCRLAFAVSQSDNDVKSSAVNTLPDLTSRTAVNPRDLCDITVDPPAVSKPCCPQSPPLAARHPLRRKPLSTASRACVNVPARILTTTGRRCLHAEHIYLQLPVISHTYRVSQKWHHFIHLNFITY